MADTVANIRFLHAGYDPHDIDLYVNSKLLLRKFPFQKVSDYILLKPGLSRIAIFSSEKPAEQILSTNIIIERGKLYTLALVGKREKTDLLTFENNPGVPLDETKMRFLHLAPETASLDFAVKDRDVVFPNISYQQVTDYLGLTPMTVDLELRSSGSKQVVLPMPKLQFKANKAYTAVLFGSENGLAFSILLD